jgi:hypothetical protein
MVVLLKNERARPFFKNTNGSYYTKVVPVPDPVFIKNRNNLNYRIVQKTNKLPNFFKRIEKPTNLVNAKGLPIFVLKLSKKIKDEPRYYHKTLTGKLAPRDPSFRKGDNGKFIPLYVTNTGLRTLKNNVIWKNKEKLFYLNKTKRVPVKKTNTVLNKNKNPRKLFLHTGNNTGFFDKKKAPIIKAGKTFYPSGAKAYFIKNILTGNIRALRNNNVVPDKINTRIIKEKAVRGIKKMFDSFIKELKTDPEKRFDKYYIPMFNKLFNKAKKINHLKYPGREFADIISKQIGPCHLKANANLQSREKYLPQLYQQLVFITSEFNNLSDVKKAKFVDVFANKLGDRPCLENALHEGVEALLEPVFQWVGKNIDPLNSQNGPRYVQNVIRPAMLSWIESLDNTNKRLLDNMNLNQRKNMFWQKIKDRNLHTISGGGIPIYAKVSSYDVNGAYFKRSNLANQLEWV